MILTNRELKIIIFDFHQKANRLMQTHNEEFTDNIGKFISYIDSQPVIKDFIDSCGSCDMNVDEEFKQVFNSYDRAYFILGDTDEDETIITYTILKEMANRKINYYSLRGSGYGAGSDQYSDLIKDFNERVSLVLINQISAYLTKLGIDRGFEEKIETHIVAGDGNQINVANNGSTITAVLGLENKKLDAAINEMLNTAQVLSEVDRNATREFAEVIKDESNKVNPRKSMINTAVNGLKMIKGTTEFAAAVATIIQLLQSSGIM